MRLCQTCGQVTIVAWLVTGFVFLLPSLARANPVSIENTLAFELLRTEARVRTLPPDLEPQLRRVLADAAASLGPNARPPSTAQEFVAFAERISEVLARNNFIQPVQSMDWVDTLGQALTPVPRDHSRLAGYLAHPQNARRVGYADPARPYYFVDCDIASIFLISVAQMTGFDIRLVEIPKHNFVRWEGADGSYANWDWTYWGSLTNEDYVARRAIPEALILQRSVLQSQSLPETRGYYLGIMANRVDDPVQELELRRRSIAAAPNNPVTANNTAWLFATGPEALITPRERNDAIYHGLNAWAADPQNPGRMDTAACSFMAAGDRGMAVAIQAEAVNRASTQQAASFRANLERLRRGELCQ